jgi:hypothetical protein
MAPRTAHRWAVGMWGRLGATRGTDLDLVSPRLESEKEGLDIGARLRRPFSVSRFRIFSELARASSSGGCHETLFDH